ncbi:MAG: nitrogen regulation protein NR(I) [Proteobacteria bacterium]|uniref:DNA-binding transcriptional regulator NtrC n=1 Tax=Candidatus Avisuccinivibrio stercorigallinarum TaxID=2840704 RepID=A0A9D9DBP2_9GAMM|nr:nitrogen regulation protein NR(I) [Candidatus Avisuccinivibrio stercorigallinarum]
MDPIIWVIDDDDSIRFVFDKALDVNSITHRLFEDGEKALEALKTEVPDVIISDIKMPGIDGLSLIQKVHAVDDTIPFIIITAHSDLTAAIESYEHGTFEYLPKPFDIEQAIAVVRRAAVHRFNQLKKKTQDPVKDQVIPMGDEAEIIGKSPAMQEVFKLIGRVSKADVPVLIQGEPGTGRELVALAMHNHSERKDKPFVSVNMSSMPQDMIEYELFGRESDAESRKNSAVQRAEGGTLFINEICQMPIDAQIRLLQILQNCSYLPVGSTKPVSCKLRIIASSSEDLERSVATNHFIADLLYRLNVIHINMPPLRDRNNDIPMLAKHFLTQAALENNQEPKKLTSEVLVFLCRQQWPGNVRQLKNLCKYLTIMVTGRDIQLSDLPADFLNSSRTQQSVVTSTSIAGNVKEPTSWQDQLRNWVDGRLRAGEQDILSEAGPEFERVMLEAALEFTGNHKQESAKLLGWGRNTLTRKIKELNLNR